jgi:hypothetical protein
MDMDGKAIELIQASAKAEHYEIEHDGLLFSTKALKPVFYEPRPAHIQLRSLTGIVDYIKSEIDFPAEAADREARGVMLHVAGPGVVALVSKVSGKDAQRTTWLCASIEENPFKFGQRYDPESFNIALQSLFADRNDRAKVLLLAGTIKSEAAQTDSDDGITQTVEAKRGVTLAQNAKIPNPVTLRPWRTFREVEQPASLFVFRAHEGPQLSLHEADGAAWKLEAMQSIKAWLAENLPGVAIIA